jgi:adenine-specific DNA-methyltransferase
MGQRKEPSFQAEAGEGALAWSGVLSPGNSLRSFVAAQGKAPAACAEWELRSSRIQSARPTKFPTMTTQTAELQVVPTTRPIDRAADFRAVAQALSRAVKAQTRAGIACQGDAIELMRWIPDQSISLVVTDPPYHTTKKANITGDRAFRADDEYLDWITSCAREWQRILRPNGSLYLFCSTPMSSRLEVLIGEHLEPLSNITWTKPNEPGFDGWKGKMRKEALRRWYPHSERILFFGQAAPGHIRRSTLGTLLRRTREEAAVTAHQLTERIGAYGRVNHGGAVSNWETGRNVPSREQYNKVAATLVAEGAEPLPDYEDAVHPFDVTADVEYTDVWDFPSVRPYRGKHPAEKPAELLRHIVESSSYPGDLVLDCFSGSGASIQAAVTAGRRGIGIDIEPQWAAFSGERLREQACEPTVVSSRELAQRRGRRTAAGSDETLF